MDFQKRKMSINPDFKSLKMKQFVNLTEQRHLIDINTANNIRSLDHIFNKENTKKVSRFFNVEKFKVFQNEEIQLHERIKAEKDSPKVLGKYDSTRIINSCTGKLNELIKDLQKHDYYTPVQHLLPEIISNKLRVNINDAKSSNTLQLSPITSINKLQSKKFTQDYSYNSILVQPKQSMGSINKDIAIKDELNTQETQISTTTAEYSEDLPSSNKNKKLTFSKNRNSLLGNLFSDKKNLSNLYDKISLISKPVKSFVETRETIIEEPKNTEFDSELYDKFNSLQKYKKIQEHKHTIVKNYLD